MMPAAVSPLWRVGISAAIMLGWGLPLTVLTLRILRVSEEQHLVAGSFLAAAYGLLAAPILRWLAP
jgi:hypothetical protein